MHFLGEKIGILSQICEQQLLASSWNTMQKIMIRPVSFI